jgi:hypothetical protein
LHGTARRGVVELDGVGDGHRHGHGYRHVRVFGVFGVFGVFFGGFGVFGHGHGHGHGHGIRDSDDVTYEELAAQVVESDPSRR